MTQSLKRQRINGDRLTNIMLVLRNLVPTPIVYDYPDPNRVLGIDLHQYSGKNVDWEKAKANGIKFALIKCMNGINLSPNFRNLWEGAAKAGILRGAWMWLYPASVVSPGRQAREFVRQLGDDIGELPIQVDYEWTKSGGRKANPTQADLWGAAKPLEDLLQKKPIIYSASGYLSQYKLSAFVFGGHDLWLAQYNKFSNPVVPAPFTKWTFWQWTDKGFGEDYGVDKYSERAVDLNYFNGSLDDLYKYAKNDPPAPPITEEQRFQNAYEKAIFAPDLRSAAYWGWMESLKEKRE